MTTHAPIGSPTQLPRTRSVGRGRIATIVASVLLVLVTIITLVFMTGRLEAMAGVSGLGPVVVVAGVVALIPLGFVIWTVLAIDRWEPEPPVMLIGALIWGATMAIVLTLELGGLLGYGAILTSLSAFGFPGIKITVGWHDWLEAGGAQALVQALHPIFPNLTVDSAADFVGAVVQAPVVEELWKAVPVVVAFVVFRKYFDGPIDGVVLASLSAAGFAYTENIQYFGVQTLAGGLDGFLQNFFARGVMSPLTHAIFTAVGIGLALGIAARLSSRLWALLLFPLGYGVSVFLHALWNSVGFWLPLTNSSFFIQYLLVQVPIAIAALLLVLLLRRFERRITRLRLEEYATAGWFSAEEADRLGTSDGRGALLDWAKPRGLAKAMQAYVKVATRLALNRQRVLTGRDKLRPVADEATLLGDIGALREHMVAHSTGGHAEVMHGQPLPVFAGEMPYDQRFAGAWSPHLHAEGQVGSTPAWASAPAAVAQQPQSQQPQSQQPQSQQPPLAQQHPHSAPQLPPSQQP